MNLFVEKHQALLRELISHGVKFLLVGGYSVIIHGYKRTTGDMDIWLKPTNEAKPALTSVLRKLDISSEELDAINALDFSNILAFSVFEPPEQVDFLTQISMVDFDEAYASKIIAEIDGIQVPVIHLNHLVLSKINTGRAQDKADIEALQNVARNRKKE